MTRDTMKRLRVGDVVQSSANLDRGVVLLRTKKGLEIRWRGTGIREFVLFSEWSALIEPRPSLVALDRVQRAAMLRRQVIPPREFVPDSERERIARAVAELRAWKRTNPERDEGNTKRSDALADRRAS